MDHSNHTLLRAGSQTAVSDRMRELLAQAAQDHVYEQRTQGAVLDEIRQRMEGTEWLLREVRERELGGLSSTLAAIGEQLDRMNLRAPGWAEGLTAHLDAIRGRVELLGDLSLLGTDVGALGESVDDVLGRLQSVLDESRITAERLGAVDGSLADLLRRADGLESAVPAAGTDVRLAVERMAEGLERIGERIDDLRRSTSAELTALGSRVEERVELSCAELRQELTLRMDAVDHRVGELEAALGERLRGLDGRLEAVDDQLASTGARIARLPSALDLADLRQRLIDLVETRPDHEQFAALLNTAAEAVHSDVADRLAGLEETLLALAEALLRPARSGKD
ncbi:hypothetical protein [Rhizohabitans arisaemae]|uniref:hypothetical protein n=1 Tax=Rhizohabitans arisaemae TaxID=2720610 RepID=UPI0024B22AA3|nr:hypothetical protein [Rhizohabitans arisaemae]